MEKTIYNGEKGVFFTEEEYERIVDKFTALKELAKSFADSMEVQL